MLESFLNKIVCCRHVTVLKKDSGVCFHKDFCRMFQNAWSEFFHRFRNVFPDSLLILFTYTRDKKYLLKLIFCRNIHAEVVCVKSALKEFTRKHLCFSLFALKSSAWSSTNSLKRDPSKDVFLWTLQIFEEDLFCRTFANGCSLKKELGEFC